MFPSVFRAAGCPACRSSLLRVFTGNGKQLPTASSSRALGRLHQQRAQLPAARFYSSREAALEDTNAAKNEIPLAQESSQPAGDASEVPWYLEVEPPRHPGLAHHDAPLPDVPEGSPRLVEPLLKFVADDLGLDDLNLLDLRALDPPPALGPQLIMLFGTARSERHLHVSADRLVRWLRNYGIHATADGLLGRNELKIKLRRKARKAKLLGNTGRIPGEDDGISTRWICVNFGTMNWAAEEEAILDTEGKHAGFGVAQVGTTIVVQMFTEAKRRDLDLETLWERLLKRSEQQGTKIGMRREQSGEHDAVHDWPMSEHSSGAKSLSQPGQKRFFTTAARHSYRTPASTEEIAQIVSQPVLDQASMSRLSRLLSHDVDQKTQLLENMKLYFASLPPEIAAENLKPDPESSFLKVCRLGLDGLPAAETWSFRAWLHSTARILGCPEYTFAGLKQLIDEMLMGGVAVPREQNLQLLRATYCKDLGGEVSLQERSELAMEVLTAMFERGEPIIANDVIVALVETLSTSEEPEAAQLQQVVENFTKQLKLTCMTEPQLIRLMDVYSDQDNWDMFWEIWRMPPRYRKARSSVMYEYIWQRLASTGHQTRCIEGLRWTFQEVFNEDPVVHVTDSVRKALLACVRVADPQAESLFGDRDETVRWRMRGREFVRLLYALDQRRP